MDSSDFYRLLACVLFVAIMGCKRETDVAKPAPGAVSSGAVDSGTTSATATNRPATPDDVVGQWQAVKVDSADHIPLPADLLKDVLSTKVEIFPNHHYRFFKAGVRSHGTWELAGNSIRLHRSNEQAGDTGTTYIVESPRLADRDRFGATMFEKQGPPSDPNPKFKLTASQLVKDVQDNPAGGKAKYDGVLVEISGIVTGVRMTWGDTYVDVAGPPADGKKASDYYNGTRCSALLPEPWATIGRTQPVKVLGIVSVFENNVELSEATFILDGPSVLITTSIEDLAAEFAKDADAAKQKYQLGQIDGKTLIVTGTVLGNKVKDGTDSELYLGSGTVRVVCKYNPGAPDVRKAMTSLQAGQHIKLAAIYNPNSISGLELVECALITK